MPKYLVGEIIKRLREQRGMSQHDLAYKILDRGHLSKIENGKTMPSKQTLEVLLERLGYNPGLSLDFFLNNEEAEFQSIMDKLDDLLRKRESDEADILITQLEKNERFIKNNLNKQYLLYCKAGNAFYKNEGASKVLGLLTEAIKISIPRFKEEDIDKYFLTKIDISIINMFALVYGEEKQLSKAINLLYRLKDNFDSRFMDNESKGRHYPMVIDSLTRYLSLSEKYKEAIELCDIGIEFCISTSHLRLLPSIVLKKAYSLYELGDNETCKELLRQAHYACEMYRQFENIENIKSYIQERPDIAFF